MKFLPKTFLIFFLINFSFFYVFCQDEDENLDEGYVKLLSWGKSHNLNITDKIRFIKSKESKQYIAKNLIPEDFVIMDIPPDCMLNINQTLSLLNMKKYRKGYEKYQGLEKLSTEVQQDTHHAEQAFMAYVLYIVNKKKKTYEKNNFYKYYSPIYYALDVDMDHLPFSFSSDQMKLFFNTSLGSIFEVFNRYIQEEVTTFEKKIFNKTIEFEDYLQFRVATIQNSFEINQTLNIIPFVNYIKKDFKKVNCEFKFEENGHMVIKANANIFPGEELIMKPVTLSNEHRFVFFGDTFDEIKDKFNTFNIPSLIPQFITNKPVDFDIYSLGPKARVDLTEIDFYKGLIFVYKKFARAIGEDDSDMGACKLILKYITRLKENYELISMDKIRKEFFNKRDIENVWRIIDGEKMFMERRIDILKTYMRNQEERSKEKKNYDAEDVNDL